MKTVKVEQVVLPYSHPMDPAKAVWVITTDGVPGLAYYLTEGKAKQMLAIKLRREHIERFCKGFTNELPV